MALPLPLLLLVGLGLALLTQEKKKTNGKIAPRAGEEIISAQELEFLDRLPDGSLRYKPESHLLGAMSLQTKEAKPFQAMGSAGELGFTMIQHDPFNELKPDPVPSSFVGAIHVANAYEAAKQLHSLGFDVWITPTLFPRDDQIHADKFLVGFPPAVKPIKDVLLALYRKASDPWPIQEQPLPPPPSEAPALPFGA